MITEINVRKNPVMQLKLSTVHPNGYTCNIFLGQNVVCLCMGACKVRSSAVTRGNKKPIIPTTFNHRPSLSNGNIPLHFLALYSLQPDTALLHLIPIFSTSSIAFLMFSPSPPRHVKTKPHLALHSLHSSPPTSINTQLNLHPAKAFALPCSNLFGLFDFHAHPWTDQGGICTSMDGPGGNRTPPSPNCHLVHQPQKRPPWPPELGGKLPQSPPFCQHCPRTLFSLRSQ